MKRPCDSATLGRIGESNFYDICTRGGLIVNKAINDLTGWDYNIEFPYNNKSQSMDLRPSLKCIFQIKAMWIDNDIIKCRLSSLERLAKNPDPSFICALKYNMNKDVVESYIIHIADDVLILILKRLREATYKRKTKVNDQFINLSVNKYGNLFLWNESNLNDTVRKFVSDDYILNKQNFLFNSGFDKNRFIVKFSINKAETDLLEKALLGINATSVQFNSLHENRFGISLEKVLPINFENIKIIAQPSGASKISFSNKKI